MLQYHILLGAFFGKRNDVRYYIISTTTLIIMCCQPCDGGDSSVSGIPTQRNSSHGAHSLRTGCLPVLFKVGPVSVCQISTHPVIDLRKWFQHPSPWPILSICFLLLLISRASVGLKHMCFVCHKHQFQTPWSQFWIWKYTRSAKLLWRNGLLVN